MISMVASMPEIVGEVEIAARLHIDEDAVHTWAAWEFLPPPEGRVAGFPAWRWITVQNWAMRTGRMGLERAILELLRRRVGGWDLPTLHDALAEGGIFTEVEPTQLTSTLEDLLEAELVVKLPGERWSLSPHPMY